MKSKKDYYTKDILLKQILQEISDENPVSDDNIYQKEKHSDNRKKLSKKKNAQKTRQRIIIGTLVILIIYVLFNLNDETKKINHHDSKKSMYSIPKANQITQPKEQTKLKKEPLVKEEPIIKISEIATIEDIKIDTEPKTENVKVLNVQEPRTERERAKESLMQQMQN